MDAREVPQFLNKNHLKHRYEEKKEEMRQLLKPRKGKLSKKKFNSVVARATAAAFRSELKSPVDDLTGLIKKVAFVERLRGLMDKVKRSNSNLFVIYIDLDGFKNLNDKHGHLSGDNALKQIAGELLKSVRPYDVVGRLGGDEFAIIEEGESTDSAEKIAFRVEESIKENKWQIKGLELLSASIGTAQYNSIQGNISPQTLIERAEIAMYNAKSVSGTHVVRWQLGMERPKLTSSR